MAALSERHQDLAEPSRICHLPLYMVSVWRLGRVFIMVLYGSKPNFDNVKDIRVGRLYRVARCL